MMFCSEMAFPATLTPRAPHRTLTACGRKLPIGAPKALSKVSAASAVWVLIDIETVVGVAAVLTIGFLTFFGLRLLHLPSIKYLTLGEASKETGVQKSTLSKALKSGKLSYFDKTSAA